MLMFDLDWFKKINDEFGHHSGDMVLANFGKILANNLRAHDFCARIGGEEFVALLIGIDNNQAVDLAKRINKELSHKNDSTQIPITVSVGIAMTGDVGYLLEDLLKAADTALYKAKADGRNCTRSWAKELNNELKTNSSLI